MHVHFRPRPVSLQKRVSVLSFYTEFLVSLLFFKRFWDTDCFKCLRNRSEENKKKKKKKLNDENCYLMFLKIRHFEESFYENDFLQRGAKFLISFHLTENNKNK